MRVIFLDIDGVLNSIDHLVDMYNLNKRPYHMFEYPFDEKCITNLLKLVKKTDAKIVITSTWRMSNKGIAKMLEIFNEYNLADLVIGYTSILHDQTRGKEIKTFLDQTNENIDNFVIIDDDSDMDELVSHLVKTNAQTGLIYENVLEALKVFKILKE